MGINIPVLDMYGMSESTGPITIATLNTWRLGSVGLCLDGAHLKIDSPDENGEGEVSDASKLTTAVFCVCMVTA